jgi:MFS superfamily sulfate permease-like transporter
MRQARPFRPETVRDTAGQTFAADVLASVVVFLVALPLCLGIALASGVPPALGLVTGIVGGIVVGFLQGSPLQVSGPAAGLTVVVLEIVGDHGTASLGAIVLAAGIIQVAAGVLRGGRWFRAVPPSVVHGMLAGIGILIVTGQFHAMIDHKPPGGGLDNLLAIPSSLAKVFAQGGTSPLPHTEAALVGLLTILAIAGWSRFRPERLRVVPGALVAVALATAVVNAFGLEVARVQLPGSLLAGTIRPRLTDLLDPAVWATALGVAAVASAETLLCAGALDRLHRGPRANYNRELLAQGAGNAVCGLVGALPMTAVIVRSSTNVQAGGRTRTSTILHGVWILLFATLARHALGLIPVSCLAAVLVATGWKLVDRSAVRELRNHGPSELAAYGVTVAGIVVVDLLVGVLAGLAVAVAILLLRLSQLSIDVEHLPEQGMSRLHLRGSATFLRLPDIAEALNGIPADAEVHVHLDDLAYLDHATVELLAHWEETHRERGGQVFMDWDDLHRRRSGPLREIVLPDGRSAGELPANPL